MGSLNRVLVACSMKSGSTFTARVLADYLGVEYAEANDYWGRREQNLFEHSLAPWRGRGFVLQMHLKPHVPNVELLRRWGIQVVVLSRNLGDVVISFDDHIAREDYRNPVGYVQNQERFNRLPRQHRYRQIIEQAIPWYLGFHLAWRDPIERLPVTRAHYEDLANRPLAFFAGILRGLGRDPDVRRLKVLLSRPIGPGSRFNQGVNGRSVTLLSKANRARLEEMLLGHVEDLAPLWWELPWRGEGSQLPSSFLKHLQPATRTERAPLHHLLPGGLLAPGPGRTARIRLVVWNPRRSVFRLEWPGGEQRVTLRPAEEPTMVEFVLDSAAWKEPPQSFRLTAFQRPAGFGLIGPSEGEILEAVRFEE